jgi:hypothetical protein
MDPIGIRIKYKGKLVGDQWMYDHPKTVELPIPFVSKSEKIGEVTCDPIGEFPWQEGRKLLDLMAGQNGPFEFVENVYPVKENGVDHPENEVLNKDDGANVIDVPTVSMSALQNKSALISSNAPKRKLSMEEIGQLPLNERPKDRWGKPILTPDERFTIKRRINAAKLKRGERRRARRSDAGISKPFNKAKNLPADPAVQPQADSDVPTAETPGTEE